MKKRSPYILILLMVFVCIFFMGRVEAQEGVAPPKDDSGKTPCDYVRPFIGTGGDGHTYPGASVPFGMVQVSPDTTIKNYKESYK